MIEIIDMKTAYSYGEEFCIPKLTFAKGEITSIIGKNGSGKTTLLRTVAGFLPYEGIIRIKGKECRELGARERALMIAYLPQMVKPVNLSVEMLVCHGRYPYLGNYRRMSEHDKEIVRYALDITCMTSFRKRLLNEISGGELKRAYLAMVIAQNTDMILLDEPAAYMDVENRNLYYSIIKQLTLDGRGIIQNCHDIEQGFSYSDRIVLMSERTIAASGTTEELAAKEKMLRDTIGVYIKKTADMELLYPYVLVK